MVAKVFELFPDAQIAKIRTPEAIALEAAVDALPEVEDEWDPFEEE
jgi:DNA polymerase-3 subunit gamma/tau